MDAVSPAVAAFWAARRLESRDLPVEVPLAWGFGATPEHADGEHSVVLDGTGQPRAVIVTTDVRTVPFDRVDPEHARAEGEGDRTLTYWRASHERYLREHSEDPRGWAPDMPVVCERFRLVWPTPSDGPTRSES